MHRSFAMPLFCRERGDAAAQMRKSQATPSLLVSPEASVADGVSSSSDNGSSLAASIDELVAALKPGGQSAGGNDDRLSSHAGKLRRHTGLFCIRLRSTAL